MAQVILIVGLILSYIASVTVAVLMEDTFGFGIVTKLIPAIIAYNCFSLIMKGLWRKKDWGGILFSIVVLILIHAMVTFIGSFILNISFSIFSIESMGEFIGIEIANTVIFLGLFIIVTYSVAYYFKKHYNINEETINAEIEKETQDKLKAIEKKKAADEALKEKINTPQTIHTPENINFKFTHPDVKLSEMENYIETKISIKEIEKQILQILEATSLPADTLMVLSRNSNMARRMNVLSSEFYAMIEEVIGVDTHAKQNAANMIKPLAIQAMIVSKNAEK